ncbi:unnamed protein product [Plutella xylostella]|uniref:(diamondback moth) hypothetical protein n=1 Tax=Plutella xylostella TaxID=51655 RepID=A0A8S4FTT2_PLUXY|nr:unnamed protein product [Plutella xylostella]
MGDSSNATLLIAINKIGTDLSLRLSNLEDKIESTETRITTKINHNIDEKFGKLQEEVDLLQSKQLEQERRIDALERQLKRRNLIIFGIAEEEKSYHELEKIVLELLSGKLDVECTQSEIQEVKRIGIKKSGDKPRPILLTIASMGKKIEICQNKHKLQDTGSYIKEDYSKKVLEIRKSLQEDLKREIGNGNRAYLKYDKLIVIPKSNKRAFSVSPNKNEKSSTLISPQTTPNEQVTKKNKRSTNSSPRTNNSIVNFMNRNNSMNHQRPCIASSSSDKTDKTKENKTNSQKK